MNRLTAKESPITVQVSLKDVDSNEINLNQFHLKGSLRSMIHKYLYIPKQPFTLVFSTMATEINSYIYLSNPIYLSIHLSFNFIFNLFSNQIRIGMELWLPTNQMPLFLKMTGRVDGIKISWRHLYGSLNIYFSNNSESPIIRICVRMCG